MDFVTTSFRHGQIILENHDNYSPLWNDLISIIQNISDSDLIRAHESFDSPPMSLSKAINNLLKERFVSHEWKEESNIFYDENNEGLGGKNWRLDFAKKSISVEVAFNHGEAIAWNLLKPVLAGELNHVKKQIDTEIGVVICATQELKESCAFDSAVGEYEKFIRYLKPLRDVLTVPMVIIGLKAPVSFKLEKVKIAPRKNIGKVVYINND